MNQPPFHYHDGELYCEHVALRALATAVGTPVYVYSKRALHERALGLLDALPQPGLACFAVKANGNPVLLRELGGLGIGADVTSGGELFLALHAGIPPQRILFSGVGKTTAEMNAALDAGIKALHVESEDELDVLVQLARRRRQTVPIGVRVNPNIAADTHPSISTGLQTHKFGVVPATAVAMLQRAAADPFLRPVGLACHIGSQITDLAPFQAAARFLLTMATDLAQAGIRLDYLDLGGGLGIDYANDDAPAPQTWVRALAQITAGQGYQLVVEPGRALVGPAGALLTQVIYTKDQGGRHFAIVDAGMSDLLRPALYSAYHPILAVQQGTTAVGYDVVGPICETGDWLGRDRALPALQAGDLLAVTQAGAYGYTMSSNYNGRLRPAEVLVDGRDWRIIRARETLQDLLNHTA